MRPSVPQDESNKKLLTKIECSLNLHHYLDHHLHFQHFIFVISTPHSWVDYFYEENMFRNIVCVRHVQSLLV